MVYLTAKHTHIYIYKNVLSIHRRKMSSEELGGRQYKQWRLAKGSWEVMQ